MAAEDATQDGLLGVLLALLPAPATEEEVAGAWRWR